MMQHENLKIFRLTGHFIIFTWRDKYLESYQFADFKIKKSGHLIKLKIFTYQMDSAHPFENIKKDLQVGDKTYHYFDMPALGDERLAKLPFSIRVLLESAIRNCDEFKVKKTDVETIMNW